MQVTNYTVNALGLQEIRTFLANNHKKGSDHFTEAMIRAWAADAEDSLDSGSLPIIEIRSFDSISGHTVTYQISDAGVDSEVVEA